VIYKIAFAFQFSILLGVVVLLWIEAFRNPHWLNFTGALAATVLYGLIEYTLSEKSGWR